MVNPKKKTLKTVEKKNPVPPGRPKPKGTGLFGESNPFMDKPPVAEPVKPAPKRIQVQDATSTGPNAGARKEVLAGLEAQIRSSSKSAGEGCWDIGAALSEIKKERLYKLAGCPDLAEYAEKAFDFSRGTASGCIAVYERIPRDVAGRLGVQVAVTIGHVKDDALRTELVKMASNGTGINGIKAKASAHRVASGLKRSPGRPPVKKTEPAKVESKAPEKVVPISKKVQSETHVFPLETGTDGLRTGTIIIDGQKYYVVISPKQIAVAPAAVENLLKEGTF